jgi:hypothetical protein
MPKSEWTENDGEGVIEAGVAYCCEGCAHGTGCTCIHAVEKSHRAAGKRDYLSDPGHMGF